MRREPSDLERFVDAQREVYEDVVAELKRGRKTSHWMWFVFPQLRSLGRSGTAKFYGIEDAKEATAYWRHPLLGARLVECAGLVLAVEGSKTAHDIFGSPDDLKLKSCMTLFEQVADDATVFAQVLERFYDGERDRSSLLGS